MFLYSFSFLEIKKSKNMTHCKSYTTSFILFLLVSLNIFFLFFLFLIFIVKLFSFLSKHFSHVILNINKISSMLFVFDILAITNIILIHSPLFSSFAKMIIYINLTSLDLKIYNLILFILFLFWKIKKVKT